VRYQFIEAHRAVFEVQVMCDVLDVSRSGYYAWRTRPASAREMADGDFVQTIRRIHF
jgi:putative transposase